MNSVTFVVNRLPLADSQFLVEIEGLFIEKYAILESTYINLGMLEPFVTNNTQAINFTMIHLCQLAGVSLACILSEIKHNTGTVPDPSVGNTAAMLIGGEIESIMIESGLPIERTDRNLQVIIENIRQNSIETLSSWIIPNSNFGRASLVDDFINRVISVNPDADYLFKSSGDDIKAVYNEIVEDIRNSAAQKEWDVTDMQIL